MQRGVFSRSVALVVGAAVLLAYASDGRAWDASDYYPLKVGNTWRFDVERRLVVQAGSERIERYLEGWLDLEVIGLSPLSGAGTVVYKVRKRVALGDVGTAPTINWDVVMDISSSKDRVRLHGWDSRAFQKGPGYLVHRNPVINKRSESWYVLDDQLEGASELVAIQQLGEIREEIALMSQSSERVRVPAGSFRRSIKRVAEGTLYGQLGDRPIKVGRVSWMDWYAKGAGPVRFYGSRYLKARTPEGTSIVITETETWRLSSYRLQP